MENDFKSKFKDDDPVVSSIPQKDNKDKQGDESGDDEVVDQTKKVKEAIVPKRVDLNRYRDRAGLTLNRLNFGLVYIKYHKQVRITVVLILVIISAFTWGRFLWTFGEYYAVGMDQDDKMLAEMISVQGFSLQGRQMRAAVDIRILPARVFKIGTNKYDFLTLIKNSNKDFYLEFDYAFFVNGKQLATATDFIYPSQDKYIVFLGAESSQRPTKVEAKILVTKWKRINKHEIPDWESYYKKRFDFNVENIKFTPGSKTNLSEKQELSTLSFEIVNNSPYSYVQGDATILLYAQNDVVSVNKYVISMFQSDTRQNIDITWPHSVKQNINKVDVFPSVDITKEENYFIR